MTNLVSSLSVAIPSASRRRSFAAILSVLIWFALLLQLTLTVEQSIIRGLDVWYAVGVYFGFFTIVTNLLVAMSLSLIALMPRSRAGQFLACNDSVTGIAASIVLVGVAYELLLRGVWHPTGWQLLADILLHDVNPIAYLGFWWLADKHVATSFGMILHWCLYPAAYFCYALARGLWTGWYPYFFLDVHRLGLSQVVLVSIGILLGFVAIAAALIGIDRWRMRCSKT